MARHERVDFPLPVGIYLEPTNRCNLHCRTCVQYRGMAEPARDLTLDEARQISDQFPRLERAALHGIGEPLLNSDLFGMIKHLKDRGAYVLFNTNAVLLDRQEAERLVESGLDELRVSMDAASASTYARIRSAGCFELVVRNIEGLIRCRAEHGRDEPKISIWMVATRENIQELPDMIRLAAGIGIEEVYLQRLVYCLDAPGRGVAVREQAIVDPPPAIERILDESLRLSRLDGISLKASGLSTPAQSLRSSARSQAPWRRCRRPWESTYITAGGNVLPCCIAPFATSNYAALILGNVLEQPFESIWQGERYRRFRSRQQSFSPPPGCQGCGVEWSI
jgi:radical SAM protein with 4Fe4S-binding SPASM domain